ncbi:MAG: ATP-binding protein, partial [Halothiobacillaceae bacterium]
MESPEIYARELPTALLADVAAIKRNSEHLANLVDDVLSLAEVDAGRMRLSPETITVQDLAAEAAKIVEPFFAQKGLFLKVEVPGDLPPVYADRLRMRQVLLNLLTNAGRFTEQGGATIKAKLGAGLIEVRVSDTGPGISQEALSKLFEPFKQADSSIRRRYGGTGLGLALSKRFVELHGGKIWIESAPGQGTTVVFTLPVQPPPAETPQRWFSPYHDYTPRERSGAVSIAKGKPCVVVLEWGEMLPRLMRRYLDDLEPLTVKDWAEAKTAVEAHSAVALVVNEATVSPTEDATLAQFAFDIPILRCHVPQPQPRWATPQIVDYLVKPIQREVLLEKVQSCGNGIRTVLLADDDAEARQLFGRILASAGNGYRVLYAMDGRSTLEMLRERGPDLLLLDLVMPNGDGFFVLEVMQREEALRRIPVIIISALDVEREPITSRELVVTRQQGLSAR